MTPNILLITADDMDAATPGAFGGPPGVTPRLDELAGEGMIFRRAHVAVAVCQPSRSAIMTGRWPHRNGAEGFGPIDDGVPLLTELLAGNGYVSGILGKVDHIQPVARFGWSMARQMRELGMGRDPAAYGRSAAEFLAAAAEQGKPWFLMVNAHDPHRPFHGSRQEREKFGDAERASYPAPSRVVAADDPGVVVPGFLPDLPEVRGEYADYLSSARRCDDVVGAVLDAVADAGHADDTLVVFLSDNGMAFPFAKANCYLRSTLTPLIVRWPGTVAPGTVDGDSFVSMLDLLPTFCQAAEVTCPSDVDGRSLVPLLRGAAEPGRDAVFTVFHETSAKIRFEMRCTQDAGHGYIWNAWSDGELEYRAENMQGETWQAMLAAAPGSADLARRVQHYRHRAPEELYDLVADPDGVHNLVDDPAMADVVHRCRRRLGAWLSATGDPLAKRFSVEVATEVG